MGFFSSNINPVYVFRRKGDIVDPYVSISETLKVNITGKVILKEIPSKFDRVLVDGLFEVQEQKDIQSNEFYVDYSLGVVYFNDDKIGQNLTFSYMGTGVVSLGASRVYVEDDGTHPVKSLQDIVDEVKIATDGVEEAILHATTQGDYAKSQGELVEQALLNTNTALSDVDTALVLSETATTNANNAIITANNASERAESASLSAETATTNANTATTNANLAIEDINAVKALAETATTNANLAGEYANTQGNLVEQVILDANTATTNAINATTNTNTAIQNANTAKDNAISATQNANTATLNANTARDNALLAIDSVNDAKLLTETATTNANTATTNANLAIADINAVKALAETATTNANIAGEYANSQGDLVTQVILDANTATTNANTATTNANQATTETNLVKDDALSVITNANSVIEDMNSVKALAETATTNANLAKDGAIQAKSDVDSALIELNDIMPNVEELGHEGEYISTTTYKKNNIVTYNGSSYIAIQETINNIPTDVLYWSILAQRGLDGTGSVVTVNGISPDLNGNVELGELGSVDSVNGQIGDVVLNANDVGASAIGHGHTISNITGLQTELNNKSSTSHIHGWVDITGKPTEFQPIAHNHTIANITGLQTELNNKASVLTNRAVIDSLTDNAGQLQYNGQDVGSVTSVNGQIGDITGLETVVNSQAKATQAVTDSKAYTDTKVAEIVDSSPETLNTLNELSQALGDDPNFATTVSNQIGTKASQVDFDTHKNDTNIHITELERTAWNSAESNSKTYTDNAISSVEITEIAHFEYKLDSIEDGQRVFTIPLGTFDFNKDKIDLYINRTHLSNDDFIVVDKNITLLNDEIDIGESLYIEIIKNIQKITQETLNGTYITNDSITIDKLSTEVETSLTKADNAIQTSQKGVANGVAPLGADNKIPAIHLPVMDDGTALNTSLTDSGGYYDSTNVEEALQELGLFVNGVRGSMITSLNNILNS